MTTMGQPTDTCELALSDMVIDEAFQVRSGLSMSAVTSYAAKYKAGGSMPPLRVARIIDSGGVLALVDGFHRAAALKRLGRETATVEIVERTARGAKWEAASANLDHGVQLKSKEYLKVFRALVMAQQNRKENGSLMSYREIAAKIGGTKSHNTIHTWMKSYFPKTAEAMRGRESGETGEADTRRKPPIPGADLLACGVRGADNAAAAAKGVLDPRQRGELIEALRAALEIAATAGPFESALIEMRYGGDPLSRLDTLG